MSGRYIVVILCNGTLHEILLLPSSSFSNGQLFVNFMFNFIMFIISWPVSLAPFCWLFLTCYHTEIIVKFASVPKNSPKCVCFRGSAPHPARELKVQAPSRPGTELIYPLLTSECSLSLPTIERF
jgi:hypothetical protein